MTVRVKQNIAGYTDGAGRFRPIRSPQFVGSPDRKATRKLAAKYSRAKAGDLGERKQKLALEDVFDKAIRKEREGREKEERLKAKLLKSFKRDAIGDGGGSKMPKTLAQFVRSEGGIRRTFDKGGRSWDKGEIDMISAKETGKRGLTTDKGGKTLDGMFQAARSAGYPVQDMYEMVRDIQDEINGAGPVYPTHGHIDYRDNPKLRRNVEMGFYSGGSFHPIRASADYDHAAAGETPVGTTSRLHAVKRAFERRKRKKNSVLVGDTMPELKTVEASAADMARARKIGRDAMQNPSTAHASFRSFLNSKPFSANAMQKLFGVFEASFLGKPNPSASRLAKAAISVFDNDLDLDLDAKDVARLKRGEKMLKRKTNPHLVDDALFRTRLAEYGQGKLKGPTIQVLSRPTYVLSILGVKNRPIVLSAAKLTRVLKEHPEVSLNVLKGLVEELENPLMVFRSANRKDSLVVITKIVSGGRPYVASFYISQTPNSKNAISSLYVKDDPRSIVSWINRKLLLYLDKSLSGRLLAWLQLPQSEVISRSPKSLKTNDDLVKKNPLDPLSAFANAAVGIASALQIKEHLNRPARDVRKKRGTTSAKSKRRQKNPSKPVTEFYVEVWNKSKADFEPLRPLKLFSDRAAAVAYAESKGLASRDYTIGRYQFRIKDEYEPNPADYGRLTWEKHGRGTAAYYVALTIFGTAAAYLERNSSGEWQLNAVNVGGHGLRFDTLTSAKRFVEKDYSGRRNNPALKDLPTERLLELRSDFESMLRLRTGDTDWPEHKAMIAKEKRKLRQINEILKVRNPAKKRRASDKVSDDYYLMPFPDGVYLSHGLELGQRFRSEAAALAYAKAKGLKMEKQNPKNTPAWLKERKAEAKARIAGLAKKHSTTQKNILLALKMSASGRRTFAAAIKTVLEMEKPRKKNGIVGRFLGRQKAKREYAKELRLSAAIERSRKRRKAAEERAANPAKGEWRKTGQNTWRLYRGGEMAGSVIRHGNADYRTWRASDGGTCGCGTLTEAKEFVARKRGTARNPVTVPHRKTFSMFQGRPATTASRFQVSRHAPAKLDQLGDLIELKLTDGQVIKPNPKRFKLCASGGKLWIAGGKFAKANPKDKANVLNPIAKIAHVVYGTYKPHHGDNAYTHYIHKLGEDTGHRPTLAVDREGFPVIRGGKYKIESRGIVN